MTFNTETLGLLTDEVNRGIGSETLLRILGPLLDSHLETLLNALDQAPVSLENLLDLRAQIKVYRSLKRELDQAIYLGIEANQKLGGAKR